MEGVPKESEDLVAARIANLRRLFPDAFVEGKLDINKLRELLGDVVETKGERYSFTWAGRITAIKNRDHRSKETLIPVRNESVNFDTTSNMIIEGDNLEVLKILQKAYEGKVKLIYIDPPYNTGNDFVYKDDFTDGLKNYLIQTGQMTEQGVTVTTNTERSGRFHSAWLTMMYPRLALARNFLSEDGIIFISIDDHEVHNLRIVMNEVFGEENFIGTFIWRNKAGGGGKQGKNDPTKQATKNEAFVTDHEYILVYGKNRFILDRFNVSLTEEEKAEYKNPDNDSRGPYKLEDLERAIPTPISTMYYALTDPDGNEIRPKGGRLQWRYSKDRALKSLEDGSLIWVKIKCKPEKDKRGYYYRPKTKQYLYQGGELRTKSARSILYELAYTRDGAIELRDLFEIKAGGLDYFSNPKPVRLLQYLISLHTKNQDIILDFFAGSGTIAQAVITQNILDNSNRKFLLVQLPEPTDDDSEARKAEYKTISDICKERVRRVIKKIAPEAKDKEVDLGFKVFKLSKSNCFIWDEKLSKDQTTLAKHIESAAKGAVNIKDKEYLVYEIMLLEGFRLDSKIEQIKNGKNHFYKITDTGHEIWICFDEGIDEHAVTELGLHKDTKLVVFDSALTDTQKVNLGRKLRIETV